jgi:hypothetical protein
MPHNVIADDAFLMTEKGPVPAMMVDLEVDRVWIVDRSGGFALSRVSKVKPVAQTAGWRLLTEAGDVVLPSGALALTSEGPLAGAEVEIALRRGQTVRLDIVSPDDLPRAKSDHVPAAEVYRSCLAALPAGVIQLPWANGIADAIAPEVIKVLKAANVHYRSVKDERWAAFILEQVEGTARGARADFQAQADVLSMVTTWAGKPGAYESRVRLGDCLLRRRLLGAAVGAGRAFTVRWLPGYCPVEARARIGSDRAWPARVAVQHATQVPGGALALETVSAGDLVVSLAVLRPGPAA